MEAHSHRPFPHCIEILGSRFSDPSVHASLKGLTRTIQISLSDLREDYVLAIRDGELASLEKKSPTDADMAITLESSLMERILSGKSNAVLAYLTGKLKVKGSMDDLLHLQKLLG